ncbi:MAG: hypothetical protein H7Z14_12110 [Anaerolineae bacterium]|nr:hypothetical protein [Phycisphaerae bacterium]
MKSTSLLKRALRGVCIGSGLVLLGAGLATAQVAAPEPATTEPPATMPVEPTAPAQTTEPSAAPATDTPPAAEVPATAPEADVVVPPPAAATQQAAVEVPPEELAARAALGERFAQLAKFTLSQPQILPALIHQNAALVEAAARENPKELRFLRLLIESRLRSADTEAGRQSLREALLQYLNVLSAQRQTDVVAQIRLIDLNERDLQSAQKRSDYLQTIVDASGVGSEVRSHAAVLLARVYAERGQDSEANSALDDAIKLSPLNMEALRARYERQGAAASDADRLAMLLAILRSNPAQPEVEAQIARELSDNGILDQALRWYETSFYLSGRMGRGLSLPDYTDYAATLLVNGQPRDAYPAAEKILQADPGNGDAALIKLAAQRRIFPADQLQAVDEAGSSMLLKKLDDLHAKVTQTEAPPTTQPIEVVNEYVLADAQKLKEGDPALASQYVGALARLAWFQIYYRQAPDTATKALDALRVLIPEGETIVTRLEGWSFLRKGELEPARNKLSAVADRDPLSKLGLILIAEKEGGKVVRPPQAAEQIDPANPGAVEASPVNDQLIQLAGQNAAGITGVVLADELLARELKFTPGPNADAVVVELNKFPKDFLSFLDRPDQFYKLTAEPLTVSHSFGQPMLARVTIQNISDYDLTLGDDAAIRPDLWFDAKLIGVKQQSLFGVTYDRIGQQVLLKAKTGSVSQVVRLDDGQLTQVLMGEPIIALPLQFSVFTNPVPSTSGGASPGPGGYRVQFTRVLERAGAPIANQQAFQALVGPLAGGPPERRMRAVDHITTLIRSFADPKAPPEMKQAASQLFEAFNRAAAMHDASPTAHAWLLYNMALISSEQQREAQMVSLLRSTAWDSRILGLRLLQAFPQDRQKQIASKFAASDPDPLVRQYATTVLETSELAMTRAPATQPADATGSPPPTDPNAPPTSPPP